MNITNKKKKPIKNVLISCYHYNKLNYLRYYYLCYICTNVIIVKSLQGRSNQLLFRFNKMIFFI